MSQIGTTTWGKNIHTCKHWYLTYDTVVEDSPNGGWPVVKRHDTACGYCMERQADMERE